MNPLIFLEKKSTSSSLGYNWLPIHVNLDQQKITWLKCPTDRFSEPFFKQSIDRIRTDHPASELVVTSFDAVFENIAGRVPSGFIFHISRCGSTLLSNSLKAIAKALVISEPQPVSALLQWVAGAQRSDQAEVKRRLQLLKAIVEAYGGGVENAERKLIFKLTSWNILHLPIFRTLWPDTPCSIVVRDPLEVGVSCMETPTGWMRWRRNPEAFSVQDAISNHPGRESFCAQILRQFYVSAQRAASKDVHIVPYEAINLQSTSEVGELFGLIVDDAASDAMEEVLRVNAKRPELGSFYPDSREKRLRATEKLRLEVDSWARPAYEELLVAIGRQPAERHDRASEEPLWKCHLA